MVHKWQSGISRAPQPSFSTSWLSLIIIIHGQPLYYVSYCLSKLWQNKMEGRDLKTVENGCFWEQQASWKTRKSKFCLPELEGPNTNTYYDNDIYPVSDFS